MQELLSKLGIDPAVLDRAVGQDLVAMGRAGGFELKAIPGGASIRGYARLRLPASGESMVLMLLSDPDPAKGVEEVMAQGVIKELPFINVHRHLKASGVPTPEVLHYNRERGLIYIEDAGPFHLRNLIEQGDREATRQGFETAIDELVKIQIDATGRPNPDFLGFLVKFDRKLLMWELDHFTEHAIRRRFPGAPTEADQRAIDAHFENITAELMAGPYALLHRDYHMDNLLWRDGQIKVIDFQDALMGPIAYDLACLLYDRDSSVLLGPDLIAHLVSYYGDAYEKRSGQSLGRRALQRNFELCVIHRMLKVVGRFHFIDQVKQRPEYLRFIPFMLPAIDRYLGRDPKLKDLLEIIRRYLPELEALRQDGEANQGAGS